MSERDRWGFFAAAALSGLSTSDRSDTEALAKVAAEIADALMQQEADRFGEDDDDAE